MRILEVLEPRLREDGVKRLFAGCLAEAMDVRHKVDVGPMLDVGAKIFPRMREMALMTGGKLSQGTSSTQFEDPGPIEFF